MPTGCHAGAVALPDARGRQHGAAHGRGAETDAGQQGDAWPADERDAGIAASAAGAGREDRGRLINQQAWRE